MHRLFEFFYQYRAFLFFVLLETICISFIVNHNNYQGAAFFNSSNRYIGSIFQVKSNIRNYFSLKQINSELAEENAKLKRLLVIEEQKEDIIIENKSDFLRTNKYEFIAAKVINNSTAHFDYNYITINKGTADGVKEGMGVISANGIVGQIKNCSDHFSTAYSMLHEKFIVFSKVKNKGIDSRVKWDQKNPSEALLLDILRHHKIAIGDTIVTSGYNTFFPEGIMVGTIKDFKLEGGSNWKVSIDLSTDFTSLSYVYIIENKLKAEQDSLEQTINNVLKQ
jgi:rod shape-determining protein MreC